MWRRVGRIVVVVLAVAIVGFLVWALWIPAPMPEAYAALVSDDSVEVSEAEGRITFQPVGDAPGCGFYFYPGGRVNPVAYAPALRAIAEAGYVAVTESMPLNLAILDIDAAEAAIEAQGGVEQWAVGGHSLGGSVATFFVHDNPDEAVGVALWAAYATEGRALTSRADLAIVSVSASLDGLATPEKVQAAMPWLPENATFVEIAGGNHAQFGWYGEQRGDNPATITRGDQQLQTVAATVQMLDAMCGVED